MTKALSDAWQAPDLDLAAANHLISSVETAVSESRSDAKWTKLWEESMTLASEHQISVNTCQSGRSHRRTQPPRRLEDCFAKVMHLQHTIGLRVSFSPLLHDH